MRVTKAYIKKCRKREAKKRLMEGQDRTPHDLSFGDFVLHCQRFHDDLYLVLECEFIFAKQIYQIKAISPDDIKARYTFTSNGNNLIPIPFKEYKK